MGCCRYCSWCVVGVVVVVGGGGVVVVDLSVVGVVLPLPAIAVGLIAFSLA